MRSDGEYAVLSEAGPAHFEPLSAHSGDLVWGWGAGRKCPQQKTGASVPAAGFLLTKQSSFVSFQLIVYPMS